MGVAANLVAREIAPRVVLVFPSCMRGAMWPLVFGITIGLACGGLGTLAWQALVAGAPVPLLPAATDVDARSSAGQAAPAVPPERRAEVEARDPGRAADDAPAETVARVLHDLLGPALRDHAIAEAQRGWREVRGDAMPDDVLQRLLVDYEQQVRGLPFAWGQRLAQEATTVEAKAVAYAHGDALTVLATVDGGEPAAAEFVAGRRFATLFGARGGGGVVDGPGRQPGQPLAAGSVLAFPAGVFALGDLSQGNEPFPSDVTVRGAGMDATLLVVDSLSARSAVDRFEIEDCTVFSESGITDMRQHAAVLSLRRVRVVGFDCGAGSAVALYLFGKSALLAVDCRFEGGYGRAPGGFANLMDTRSLCLARFERCLFDRMGLDDAGATARFVGCEMRELLGAPPAASTYENCRITVIDAQRHWDAEYRRRDLNTLFPQWRERLGR